MKKTYDRRMPHPVTAGDRVWLYNPRRKQGLSPMLQNPWEGSYTVVAALSAVTCIRRGRKCPSVDHVDRLWRYHGPGHYSRGRGEADEEERPGSSSEDDSEVELAAGDIVVSPPPSRLPRASREGAGWLEDYYMD